MGETTNGISRRTALKRIGAGAAIAWTVPAVITIENAYAIGSAPAGQAFPCSYATIIYTVGTSTTLQAAKLNDNFPGSCNNVDTDGMYKGLPLGQPCNGVQYAVDSNNMLTAGGTVIAAGSICPVTQGCCTITAVAGVTIQFVLIHDGSITGGTLTNGTTVCGPITSFSAPHGACGNGCAAPNGCP